MGSGKVYSYNSATGEGIIKLENGDNVSFNVDTWKDTSNMPKVGLNVLTDNNSNVINAKTEKIEQPLQEPKKIEEKQKAEEIENLDDEKKQDDTKEETLKDRVTVFNQKSFQGQMNELVAIFERLGFSLLSKKIENGIDIRMEKLLKDGVEKIHINDKDGFVIHFIDEIGTKKSVDVKPLIRDNKIVTNELEEIVTIEKVTKLASPEPKPIEPAKNSSNKSIMWIVTLGAIIVGGYYFLNPFLGITGPSHLVIKDITKQYHRDAVKIDVLNTAQRDAYTIAVVEVQFQSGHTMICEMPMLESKKGWMASGIDCRG